MANQTHLGRALDAERLHRARCQGHRCMPMARPRWSPVYSDVTDDHGTKSDCCGWRRLLAAAVLCDWAAKAIVVTSADVGAYTLDPCPTSPGHGAAAAPLSSFSPAAELPQTNVRDAIVAAAALSITGVSAVRVGRDGQLGANCQLGCDQAWLLDQYRFDGTTAQPFRPGSPRRTLSRRGAKHVISARWLYRIRHGRAFFLARWLLQKQGSWRQVLPCHGQRLRERSAACRIIYSDHDQQAALRLAGTGDK